MKNLTLISITFFIIIFGSKAWSQADDIELMRYEKLDTFKLKNYVLPKLRYDKLDFSVFLNSNNRQYNPHIKNDFQFDLGIYLSNHSYRNSSKLQYRGTNSIFIDGGFERRYDRINKETKNYKAIDAEIKIDNSIRFYNNSKRFFEFDINSQLVQKDGKSNIFYIREKNKGINFNINLGLNIGYGRVEDVTDAWKAIRMLKDFKKIGKLSKTPKGDDVIALANAISSSNNIRVFDKRIKRTQQLKMIDNIITDRYLIRSVDIDYFTSLYDLYSIYKFYHPIRNAGSIMSIGLSPVFSIFNSKGKYNYGYTNYGVVLEFKNEYYKPINMFYQLDFGYSLNGGYLINKKHNVEPPDNKLNKHMIVNSRIFSAISYYPSTRTVLTSKINILVSKNILPDEDLGLNNIILMTSWSNRITYYLSPRARLNLNLYLYYLEGSGEVSSRADEYIIYRYSDGVHITKPNLSKGISYYLSLKFNYAIF